MVSNLLVADYSPNVLTDYTQTQHQDAFQWLDGGFFRLCDNVVVDFANTGLGDSTAAANVLVYNNVVVHSYSGGTQSTGGGLYVEVSGGGPNVNVWAVNNTFVNMVNSQNLIRMDFGTAYTNCGIANNLSINHTATDGSTSGFWSGGTGVSLYSNFNYQSGFESWFTGYASSGVPNMELSFAGNAVLRKGSTSTPFQRSPGI